MKADQDKKGRTVRERRKKREREGETMECAVVDSS